MRCSEKMRSLVLLLVMSAAKRMLASMMSLVFFCEFFVEFSSQSDRILFCEGAVGFYLF